MARAFIQLNSQGVRISNIELLLSLLAGTWRYEIRREVESAFGSLEPSGLELQPFLRLALAGLGVPQTVVSKPERFERAVGNLAPGSLSENVGRAAEAMGKTLALLDEELGISHLSLVPSQVALVPIAYYFLNNSNSNSDALVVDGAQRRSIAAWFVLASFKRRYGGAVDTKLTEDLKIVRENAGRFPFESLVKAMRPSDQRISWLDLQRGSKVDAMRVGGRHYLMLVYVLLVKYGATDWTARLLRAAPLRQLAKYHIFPVEWLTDQLSPDGDANGDGMLANHFGNLTWIDQVKNAQISDRSPGEYITLSPREEWHVSIEDAERHFIPVDRALFNAQRYEDFLEARMENIYGQLRAHFPEIADSSD
jgi:hypothetical protein